MDPTALEIAKRLAEARDVQAVLATVVLMLLVALTLVFRAWRDEVKTRQTIEKTFRAEAVALVKEQVVLTERVLLAIQALHVLVQKKQGESGTGAVAP